MKQRNVKKISKMKAVKQQFHDRIEPLFMSWGLSQHPNKRSYFGVSDHGYRYDLADVRDLSDVKLAAFSIYQPDASLSIRGYRLGPFDKDIEDLPILFGNIKETFVLRRNWAIWRPLDVTFSLRSHIEPSAIPQKAEALIDDVFKHIGKLHRYLYD
ncbi:hypothetical protein G6L63_12310 [Agrobacterium vitis]|uniref:Uncharacterized protein n=1 Tax=Agrobacterium vitis TaxID=373 RepID=A0A368NL00_AGRVI|nr:hypothetical protein [Agrobacterium vitis]KAA3511764.1 hypothetical protein DXM22_16105 [Agrobacterium vitis]KAA3525401.1 hypothetical protein DXT89_17895 [Agrobacterium vitis]MCF1479339.1 hypothetical protein [Agrobacterium vitis]MUZ97572.1 hypothetical protein [Agrobacterium vitis]MVA30449.1 hypothetical protein [Agrobacterium vitis]